MSLEMFGFTVNLMVFWLVVTLLLLIIETITVGLTTIWFAAGSLLALVCSLLKFPFPVQIVVFFLSSICMLVFTRRIFVDKLKTGSEKTNVDALIGERGLVTSKLEPFKVGQVKVNGQVWSAVIDDDALPIEEGEQVKIKSIEGVKLRVMPC